MKACTYNLNLCRHTYLCQDLNVVCNINRIDDMGYFEKKYEPLFASVNDLQYQPLSLYTYNMIPMCFKRVGDKNFRCCERRVLSAKTCTTERNRKCALSRAITKVLPERYNFKGFRPLKCWP